MHRYEQNLRKSLEIIDVCFNLKEAYLKQRHPRASQRTITQMIYRDILHRKERQWKLHTD